MWLGTEQGLSRLNSDRTVFTHYTVDEGLPDFVVTGILEDELGYLWISMDNGKISRFDPRKPEFLTFDHSDGLQRGGFNSNCCLKGLKGELYFGGREGLNCIWPGELTNNSFVPPVVITAFHVLNESYPIAFNIANGEPITLSYQENFLSFEFAVLNYTQAHKNQYAYRMTPLEENWNYHRRFARYTDLSPGAYTFQVKGSNNDGLWNNQGATLRIVITPPFWATMEFRIFAIGFFVSLLIAGHYWRVRMMRIRQIQLEGEVENALAEIKTLKGIVPICSFCKKIRDDQGYWAQLELYISQHSDAEFSHGICPECMKKQMDKLKNSNRTYS